MKRVIAFVLLSFLCVFSQPAFAGKKRTVAEIEKEQLEQKIWYLNDRTDDLEDRVRKENITKHAQSAKRVDRDYLSKLKKVARRGDVELWNMIYQDYMHARKRALAEDQAAYDARQAQKKKNPWYNEPSLNN